MNHKQKYWLALLTEWRKNGRDGFTIPFIIGSQKYLSDNPKQDIKALIMSIIKNEEQEIYLKYCFSIEDIVMGIRDDTKILLQGHFPLFKDSNTQSKLFLTAFLNDLGENVETIISSLSDRYQNYIDKEEFSKNDRQRGDYSANESQFIRRVFSDYFGN